MRWTHLGRHALALTLSVALVACGDDDPSDPDDGDELTEAEAEVMLEALVEAGGFAFGAFGAGGPAAAPFMPVTFEESIDETASCPLGGTIDLDGNISGDVDDETGLGTFNITLTQTHNGCVARASSNNSTWTFNGAPDITLDFDWTLTETAFEFDGIQEGGIGFSGAGKNGTCTIDLTYDFSGSPDGSSFTGSVAGTVCGMSVSEQISIDD